MRQVIDFNLNTYIVLFVNSIRLSEFASCFDPKSILIHKDVEQDFDPREAYDAYQDSDPRQDFYSNRQK